MPIIQLNKTKIDTFYNSYYSYVSGYCEGEKVYLDTGGIIIHPIVLNCVQQENITNSFGIGKYFLKNKVCSKINGVFYWQSPDEIQKLAREEYKYV